MRKKKLYEPFDLIYALQNAAEFLDLSEWAEDDGGAQVAANKEGARRIRRLADRLSAKVAR